MEGRRLSPLFRHKRSLLFATGAAIILLLGGASPPRLSAQPSAGQGLTQL